VGKWVGGWLGGACKCNYLPGAWVEDISQVGEEQ
jgi:hypothetical protein